MDDSTGFSFSLNYRYRQNQEIYSGSSHQRNPNDVSTTFQQALLTGAYRVNSDWVLQATLPFVDALREENGAPDSSFSGVGDAQLSAMWTPWMSGDSVLSGVGLSFGAILPTGKARDQPQVGLAAPSVFQAGTGATQLALGLRYSTMFNDWSFRASVDATLSLEEGSTGFCPAETVFWSVGVGHPVTDKLSARLSFDLLQGGRDEFMDVEILNTGSTTLSLTPALVYRLSDEFSLSGSVSIPVYRDVNRTQLVAAPLWSVGLNFTF